MSKKKVGSLMVLALAASALSACSCSKADSGMTYTALYSYDAETLNYMDTNKAENADYTGVQIITTLRTLHVTNQQGLNFLLGTENNSNTFVIIIVVSLLSMSALVFFISRRKNASR